MFVDVCGQMFEYSRLVDMLLFTTTEMTDALFIQRIAIYLLNSLACQVDGTHKHILGDAGAVPVTIPVHYLLSTLSIVTINT